MINTKLINLIKTFNKQEIFKFKDYICSPYFNKNKNIILLANTITEYYPDFTSADFTEEYLYKKIFGKDEYDYYKLKNLISDLFEHTVSFLKIKGMQNKDTEAEILLLNSFHEKKLDKLYQQREKKLSAFLNNLNIKEEDNFLQIYQLERINTAHYKFDKSEYTFNQIQKEFDSFYNYSLAGLLRLYAKMLMNSMHGNIKFEMPMFDKVWEQVNSENFTGNISCLVFRQIIALLLSNDEYEYKKLIDLKERCKNELPKEELYYILNNQNAFSAYMLKLGNEYYYKDRFNAFYEMIENGFINTESVMFVNFISFFSSACMANEFEWAEKFLNDYQSGVFPKEEKINTLYYCKAFYAFRKQNFEKAIEYFSKTNFKFYLINVMVRSYSIRTYYEMGLYEQVISAIDAFRHYLKKEKTMAEDQKAAHYEFVRLLTRLTELKIKGISRINRIDLELLKKQSEQMSSNPLGSKIWLLQKCDEIK